MSDQTGDKPTETQLRRMAELMTDPLLADYLAQLPDERIRKNLATKRGTGFLIGLLKKKRQELNMQRES